MRLFGKPKWVETNRKWRKKMLRDHLYEWRKNHLAKNYQEYLDSIKSLPEADQECAAALWGIRNKNDILIIITAFSHLDAWRRISLNLQPV